MQWIVGLNTLRFLAILLVIIYHLFHAFLPGGFIAVEIFFGLSGFLVVSKVLQSYRGQNKFKYGRFLWERFLRLWPPLLFCVFLALILALFVQSDIVAGIQWHALSAVTFTTNITELINGGSYENAITPNIFEHTWFIALLMQLYIVIPLLIKIFISIFKNRQTGIRQTFSMLLALSIVSAALMIIHGGVFGSINRAYFALDSHMSSFCICGALAVLNYLYPRTPRTPKFMPTIWLGICLATIGLLVTRVHYADPIAFWFALPFTGLLTAVMIFCIIKMQSNSKQEHKTPAILRFLEWLGSLAFGLYLFHYPLYILLPEIISYQAQAWVVPTVNLTASFILAILTKRYINFSKIWEDFIFATLIRRITMILLLVVVACSATYAIVKIPTKSAISEQLATMRALEDSEYLEPVETPDYLGANSVREAIDTRIEAEYNQILEQDKDNKHYSGSPAATPNSASVLVIGDSVTLGAKYDIEHTIPNSYVDAKESRGIEAAAGILAKYASQGRLPKTIVISLVTNERTITDSLLQGILNVAGSGHNFILVTGYAGPLQPRETQNAALISFAAKHNNVKIADWWSIAHDNWDLMYGDHIHLDFSGRTTYANLIYETVRSFSE